MSRYEPGFKAELAEKVNGLCGDALSIDTERALLKVLVPGHGFNSERSQRAENGGRP